MTQADYQIFMRLLDSIKPPPPARYYWESDGGYCGSVADMPKVYYVCHTQTHFRVDCESLSEARNLARKLNQLAAL